MIPTFHSLLLALPVAATRLDAAKGSGALREWNIVRRPMPRANGHQAYVPVVCPVGPDAITGQSALVVPGAFADADGGCIERSGRGTPPTTEECVMRRITVLAVAAAEQVEPVEPVESLLSVSR